ncbi:MAG: (Fe-S)-binding protein [Methylomonas sp.]|jgi:glycolate oxidase iron-sulfur subunit
MFDFMDMGFDAGQTAELQPPGLYIPPASDCMRCGMCVSHCPTFRLLQTEAETPRGRIRTISKLLVEDLPVSGGEQMHLLDCLQCRACETACPSRMAYGELFDQALLKLDRKPGLFANLALWLIVNKRWRAALMPLLTLYIRLGGQNLLRRSGLLDKLKLADAEALLTPPALTKLAANPAVNPPSRGRVALFTGCLAEHFDRETLAAAIRLLNACGYEVLTPPEQGCCGAIHQHNGLSAQRLIENNVSVFNDLPVENVLYTASGCGAMLSEYRPDDIEAAAKFRQRLLDINEFLLTHWPDDLQLRPLHKQVAVHEPCSQRNVLKNAAAVYALLEKIPGLRIAPLADNNICCGAGGSYMLSHPEYARRLVEMKREAIAAAQADLVVSGNFGCAVFMNAYAGEVEHPLRVLAGQLGS